MMSLVKLEVVFMLAAAVTALPYRPYSSRSVPGRIKSSSSPDSLHEYFANYFSAVRQQQQPQYGMTEYEPPYPQYISNYPADQETMDSFLPYLSPVKDYPYDYNTSPSHATEEEPNWYDDWPENTDYATLADTSQRSSQDAALLQLFLDHLTGKYSLEDLKTLERQAAIEDNNESQLQALMAQKKDPAPIINSKPVVNLRRSFPLQRGQKEEAFMLPNSSIRKNIFVRSPSKAQKTTQTETKAPKQAKPMLPIAKASSTSAPVTSTNASTASTTVEPFVRSAYESLLSYLDRERSHRRKEDDRRHAQKKRFISDKQSLTQQLASLKKTVT